MIVIRSLTLAILGFLAACTSSQPISGSSPVPFFVTSFFEKQNIESLKFVPNKSNEKVLCLAIRGGDQRIIDYTVYALDFEEELYSSGFIGGDIRWYNNDELIITGTSRVNTNTVTITNVLTGESRYETLKIPEERK